MTFPLQKVGAVREQFGVVSLCHDNLHDVQPAAVPVHFVEHLAEVTYFLFPGFHADRRRVLHALLIARPDQRRDRGRALAGHRVIHVGPEDDVRQDEEWHVWHAGVSVRTDDGFSGADVRVDTHER